MFRDDSGELKNGISRVRYSHDAAIDLILANPGISQNEIAGHFGYSPTWISLVINSDAFQARLADRKAELIDPQLVAEIELRLKAVAQKSLEVVLEKLHLAPSDKFALDAARLATEAMGFGARAAGPAQNNQFVVVVPGQQSAADWEAEYSRPQAAASLGLPGAGASSLPAKAGAQPTRQAPIEATFARVPPTAAEMLKELA